MRYFFPLHYDGGNRGCEAIAKGISILLGQQNDNLFGLCRNVELDKKLGVDKFVTLVPLAHRNWFVDKTLGAVNRLLHTSKTRELRTLYPYMGFLKLIKPEDVMVSTGGDMLCYEDNEVIYTNNLLHNRGCKTILWGCSMGKENLTPAKKETLSRFTLISARESLTYDFFQSLGLENICLCPDPAFILPAEACALPVEWVLNNTIGLNVSNYVVGGMNLDSPFGLEVQSLVRHILDDTDMDILLVPHVTWRFRDQNQDDSEMAQHIHRKFGMSDRIKILDISDKNYCQIRYVISKCRFFIGARTHAVISAYSMCVPTIALGYSIKSRGIAKDLGLSERLVVDSRCAKKGALADSFDYMISNEENIREQLRTVMPSYKEKTYRISDFVTDVIK